MIKYFLIFIVYCVILFNTVSSQESISRCDTFVLDSLTKMNYQKFIDSSVSYFLINSYARRYKEYLFIDEPPGILSGAYFILTKNLNYKIWISTHDHIEISYENMYNWKFNKFVKEKISAIELNYKNEALKYAE